MTNYVSKWIEWNSWILKVTNNLRIIINAWNERETQILVFTKLLFSMLTSFVTRKNKIESLIPRKMINQLAHLNSWFRGDPGTGVDTYKQNFGY